MSEGMMERMYRRVLGLVGRGRVKLVRDDGAVQLMQVRLGAQDLRDGTPRVGEWGLASNPPLESDAVVLTIAGDRSASIVIGTNNQAKRMRNLKAGEVALHDDKGRYIYLADDGIHVQANGSPVTVDAASAITITCTGDVSLNVSGNITSQAASWTHTGPLTVHGLLSGTQGFAFSGTPSGGGPTGYITGSITYQDVVITATGGSQTWNGKRIDDTLRVGDVQFGTDTSGTPV